jgi:ribosome-binding factor A
MASEPKGRRPARVASDIRHALARMLARDVADPRVEGVIVSRVSLSNDLRVATIGWRLLAPGAQTRAAAQKGLERVAQRLRRAVGRELGLRHAPELRFAYDEGQDARDRIDELLEEVKRERKPGGESE